MDTTRIKNFAKGIDEMIPDATAENVNKQCKNIFDDAKSTAMCAVATCMCGSKTLMDTGMLGLMISKTVTKKAIDKINGYYMEAPAMVVRR